MNEGKISARYAKALYEFAKENGNDKKVYDEMKVIADCYTLTPDFRDALANPTVNSEAKKNLLLSIFSGNASAEYSRFVDLVLSHKRDRYFILMALDYLALYRKKNNVVKGRLVTAAPISETEVDKFRGLVSQVTDAKVDFDIKVVPDIIGGFILDVETYQLNASLKSQLNSIRTKLRNSNSSIAK